MSKKTTNSSLDLNEALSTSEAFFLKNKKTILGTVIALIVVIGGFFLYQNFVAAPRSEKASTLLAKGQSYFSVNEYDKALNGDGMGYIGFIKLADEYGSTDAGNLAKLYAGLSLVETGKAAEAVKYLEDFSTAGDRFISPAAIGALGNCYAKLGKYDDAVKTLKKAAKKADNNSLSPIYLIQAGEILESQNRKAEAKALYEEVKANYYQSDLAREIDKYIERASN